MDDDDHYLDSYLSEILPALGLDVDAYAPYVTSFVSLQSLAPSIVFRLIDTLIIDAIFICNHQMKEGSDDDDDSLDELIDLLRASSESHGEDDSAWENFREEITKRRLDYMKGVDLRKVRQR